MQQRELLDLLMCGQQVAFDAVGEERKRALPRFASLHTLALRSKALRDPLPAAPLRSTGSTLHRRRPLHRAQLNHALFCCRRSSRGSCTSVDTSSLRRSQ